MRQIRVALHGASGRMGQEIMALFRDDKHTNFYLCASLDQNITAQSYESHTPLNQWKKKNPSVVIDFTSQKGALEILDWCIKNKTPFICGTTGFTKNQWAEIKKGSRQIPIFYSANMSLGIEALRNSIRAALGVVGPCDIVIEETHHKFKKDKPSGTALSLSESIKDHLSKNQTLADIVSIRAGQVIGTHKIQIYAYGQTITLVHEAHSRKIFAEGALAAAQWLVKQKKGLYSMPEMFKGR